MKERIDILGTGLDCISAKEAMQYAMQFLDGNPVSTIELLTMNVLLDCSNDDEWKKNVKDLCMVLPGDTELLEALDIQDGKWLKETRNEVFLKMMLKYLQKKQKKVYFLAQDEKAMEELRAVVRRFAGDVCVSGCSCLDSENNREEDVVNDINGTETDCIISVIPSPFQEMFIGNNRSLLNARLWLGCGAVFPGNHQRGLVNQFSRLFQKIMFRKSFL